MNDFLKIVVYGGLFAIPFLTLFVVDSYFFPFITGKNFGFRILVEVVLVAWVVLALLDAKYRPKFSYILSSVAGLLVVMFAANLFGADPQTSFWSNFERMDGYITLVHVFLYLFVLGTMMSSTRLWNFYLHTTLGVAVLTALYGLAQYSGSIEGYQYPGRIESYLGNAAYMAIYMFFHIFITFWLFVQHRSVPLRLLYVALIVLFSFVLLQTGTRGTAIGLVAGAGVMVTYVAVFGAKFPEFRRYAVGLLGVMLVCGIGFYAARDTAFVQESPSLSRIANIDLAADLVVRGTIWRMALQGVAERPLLGWGQGNFNYVFNEQYDPFIATQEQWFDRVHNIFLDWLIAGGVLGLLAYLAIFIAALYYLLWRPFRTNDQSFTVLERAVLLGVLAGYLTHNLVVFDNIVSYIFFAVILALVHSRVGSEMPQVKNVAIDRSLVQQFVTPVAVVVLVALIYTMHVPGMSAASSIIDAYREPVPEGRLAAFERALAADSFAHQEITEQLSQQTMSMMRDPAASDELKQRYLMRAEEELNRLVAEKPGDARVHVFFSTFYRSVGNYEKAWEQIGIARDLSPRKPSIVMQQAIVKYAQNDMIAARDLFAEAFRLNEANLEAREYYAGILFSLGEGEAGKALIVDDIVKKRFAMSDFVVQAINQIGTEKELLRELYAIRVKEAPTNPQNWASLSFLYYEAGERDESIAVLREGAENIPTFRQSALCFIANIEAGKEPGEGCSGGQQ